MHGKNALCTGACCSVFPAKVADEKLVQWYSGAIVHCKELCVHAALGLKLLVRSCRHKYKTNNLLFPRKMRTGAPPFDSMDLVCANKRVQNTCSVVSPFCDVWAPKRIAFHCDPVDEPHAVHSSLFSEEASLLSHY
jgi:hypothetical protein